MSVGTCLQQAGKTGVPRDIVFKTKPQLAMQQIEAAHPRGVVLADAAYGDETAWRDRLAGHGSTYAVGIRPGTTVWWGAHPPLDNPAWSGPRGRPDQRFKRDADHQPVTVAAVAGELAGQAWRRVSWREGRAGLLSSRFARVRVRAAHQGRPREEEWLIIEWPERADESAHYGLSTLPQNTSWSQMAGTVMSRWRIERDDQELKQELGLGHYEGRNWRGFHHHASLCIAAYLPAAGRCNAMNRPQSQRAAFAWRALLPRSCASVLAVGMPEKTHSL